MWKYGVFEMNYMYNISAAPYGDERWYRPVAGVRARDARRAWACVWRTGAGCDTPSSLSLPLHAAYSRTSTHKVWKINVWSIMTKWANHQSTSRRESQFRKHQTSKTETDIASRLWTEHSKSIFYQTSNIAWNIGCTDMWGVGCIEASPNRPGADEHGQLHLVDRAPESRRRPQRQRAVEFELQHTAAAAPSHVPDTSS